MQLNPASGLRAVKRFINGPRQPGKRSRRKIVERFHKLYYYAGRQTWENYLVVEDTNINAHPMLPRYGAGLWRPSSSS